jgi:hypothetical protein
MVSSGCKSTDLKVPQAPLVDLLQPVKIKDELVCKRWRLNEEKKWYLVATENINSCIGIFGVTSKDFVLLKDYSRQIESWIGNNCGLRVNGESEGTDPKQSVNTDFSREN